MKTKNLLVGGLAAAGLIYFITKKASAGPPPPNGVPPGTTMGPYCFEDKSWGYVPWGQQQVAYRHVGKYDRLYIATIRPPSDPAKSGDIYVTYYDHTAKAFCPTPVKVWTMGGLANYDSTTPSLTVADDGHILVTGGGQGVFSGHIYRSVNAEDITQWEHVSSLASGWVPVLIKDKTGKIGCFYNTQPGAEFRQYSVRLSTDGGATWGDDTKIIDFADDGKTGYYQLVGQWGFDSVNNDALLVFTRLWTMFGGYHEQYFVRYHFTDGKIYDQADHGFIAPLTYSLASSPTYKFQVLANMSALGGCDTYNGCCGADEGGHPYIVFPVNSEVGGAVPGIFTFRFVRWSGTDWVKSDAAPANRWAMDPSTLDVVSSTNIILYAQNSSGDEVKYHWNGSSWSSETVILKYFERSGFFTQCVPVNHKSDLQMLFCEVDFSMSSELKLFAYMALPA